MFDHVGIHVSDLERSRAFYDAALAPLGLQRLEDHAFGEAGWSVYGTARGQAPFFVVASAPDQPAAPAHLSFTASSTEQVDRFHAAGLGAGGRDNGAPGPRTTPGGYYAAYLFDPDGFNVEAGVRGHTGGGAST